MNKINMIKTVAVLTMVTLALTLTIAAAPDWSQFQKDEVSIGQTADSAPMTAPDDMTIGDVQPALQGAAVPDEGTELENDGGNFLVLSDWTRYDFDVRAGEDKWAYRGGVADKPPSTCDVPSTEFSLYTAISADDGTYQSDFSNSNYAAHRFNFSIDENKVNFITKLNVTWNGKGWHDNGGTDNGMYLYIYNFSTPGYEELANNSVGTDATLTGEVTSSISNYINSGNVTVLVVQNTAGSAFSAPHIETDYVRVVVTP